jgi:serine O-acetyltransferase
LRDHLLDDARAALDGDPAARSLEEIILTYPGFQAITAHRVAHTLHLEDVPFVPRAIAEHSHERTGIDLHPGAVVGRRFFIDHGTGVVIGETSNIGDNVKIYQGVTLGALSVHRRLAGTKRHPTLEDDVVVYAGATVLGGETVIGRGAVVGGNAFITTSVAPGARVVGVSAGEERR